MRYLILSLLLSSGCLDIGWDDVPTAKVRPVVATSLATSTLTDHQAYWHDQLSQAVTAWNDVLVERGCERPFVVSDDPDAHPINLVPVGEWDHAQADIGVWSPDGWIDVRDRRPTRDNLPTIVHELGHALGLGHLTHPGSVMQSRVVDVVAFTPRDVELAMDAIGCAR